MGLVSLVHEGAVSHPIAKELFEVLWTEGGDPEAIVEARGWRQVSDTGAIDAAIAEILAAHPDELDRYRGGAKKLFGFFMGRAMGRMKGKGDPKAITARLRAALDG